MAKKRKKSTEEIISAPNDSGGLFNCSAISYFVLLAGVLFFLPVFCVLMYRCDNHGLCKWRFGKLLTLLLESSLCFFSPFCEVMPFFIKAIDFCCSV